MNNAQKVPITERALVQRITRALRKREPPELLRANRQRRGEFGALGAFFVVDLASNRVSRQDVKLHELAAELGVLEPWESYGENLDGFNGASWLVRRSR